LLLGLADLPLNIVRSFSDLVSYLRLFAVGYATLIVAITFNKMAHDLGWSSLLNGIVATSILILGHAMNIVMAALGVLVHGIRLNMLEFSTHMGMNWSGQMYRPFRKRAGEHIRQ
jgi:V/A-type H+-transporting ATPase subunit I